MSSQDNGEAPGSTTYCPRIDPVVVRMRLPPVSFHVYAALMLYADQETGRCWPSQQTLARDTGYTARCIYHHLGVLERRGVIKRVRRRQHKIIEWEVCYRNAHSGNTGFLPERPRHPYRNGGSDKHIQEQGNAIASQSLRVPPGLPPRGGNADSEGSHSEGGYVQRKCDSPPPPNVNPPGGPQ